MQPLYEGNNLKIREILQYLLLHFGHQIRYTNDMYVKILKRIVEDICSNITTNTFKVWKNSSSALKYKAILHSFLNQKDGVINTKFLQRVSSHR